MKKIEKMENSDLINSFKKITKFLIIARFQIYKKKIIKIQMDFLVSKI